MLEQRRALLSVGRHVTVPVRPQTSGAGSGASPDMMCEHHINLFDGYWFIQISFFFPGQCE